MNTNIEFLTNGQARKQAFVYAVRLVAFIRLRLNTLPLDFGKLSRAAAGMISLRYKLRPDKKARRTAPKLARAKAA